MNRLGIAARALPITVLGAALAFAAHAGPGQERTAPLYKAQPTYPPAASQADIEGEVVARVAVTGEGRVRGVTILREEPAGHEFGLAATEAIWRWKYAKDAAGDHTVTVRFQHPKPYTRDEWAALPTAPVPLVAVPARYPDMARTQGLAGEVDYVLLFDEDGLPMRAQIMHETPVDRHFAYMASLTLDRLRFPSGRPGTYRYRVTFDPAKVRPDPSIDLAVRRRPLPDYEMFESHANYPEKGREADVDGEVRLITQVDPQGLVEAMQCVSEEPQGFGFCQTARHEEETTEFGPGLRTVYERIIRFRKDP